MSNSALMNIHENVSRAQVIERIRTVPGQIDLLVVDDEADRFFHKHRLRLSSSRPFVTICPSRPSSECDGQQQKHGMHTNKCQLLAGFVFYPQHLRVAKIGLKDSG